MAAIAFIFLKGQLYIEAVMEKAGNYTNNAEEYTYCTQFIGVAKNETA
ncbi:MAG: hypothetical protein ACFWUB_07715 [Megasphaera sp.]